MRNIARMLAAAAVSIALCTEAAALDLVGADGLIDFDSAIGFPTPRAVSVFRSADPTDHLYFLIPNSVQLAQTAHGHPEFGLFYTARKAARGERIGYLTFALTPVLQSDELQAVIDDLKASDPAARFGIPNPIASTFYIVGPAFERRQLTATRPASNPLRTPSGFSVDLPSLAVRVALSPSSYKHPVFTIGHDFVLRGVERDEQGTAHVTSRLFATSFIVNGVCALRPELILDVDNGRHGCGAQSYPHNLVHQVQKLLKKRGYDPGPLDGVFGERTEVALRAFQKDAFMIVDGIPTLEIVGKLNAVAAM